MQKGQFTLFFLLLCFFYSSLSFAQPEWSWENPLPQGNNLRSIWGTTNNQIYAVGSKGTIVKHDGLSWSTINKNTQTDLADIWGTSNNNIYAVGNFRSPSTGGVALHFDGNNWNTISIGANESLRTVWGLDENNIYIGAWNSWVYYFNGTVWQKTYLSGGKHINSFWGTATNNVYAAADGGIIFRFNGTFWSTMTLPSNTTTYNFTDIWGTASNNIYAVGSKYENGAYHTLILHFNGTQWTQKFSNTGYQLISISGTSASSIYAAGNTTILKFNGTSWSPINTGLTLSDIAGLSAVGSDFYFVGSLGDIFSFNGTTFERKRTGSISHLNGITCSANNKAIAVGNDGTILTSNGSEWFNASTGLNDQFTAIWGTQETGYFITSSSGKILFSQNGSQWSGMLNNNSNKLSAIWGSSYSNVFAAGVGVILRFNGTSWSSMPLPGFGYTAEFLSIWGADAVNVYVLTVDRKILYFNGTAWSLLPVSIPTLPMDIKGTSANDIQITTSNKVFKLNGTSLIEIKNNVANPDNIVAIAPDNYFYAGATGEVTHYDGTTWTSKNSPGGMRINSAISCPDGSVLFAGNNGTIIRYGDVNHAPQVVITSPTNGQSFNENENPISLNATANDDDGGDISHLITWTSNIDGQISSLVNLSAGTHTITAKATDNKGLVGQAAITVIIAEALNTAPEIIISSPSNSAAFEAGASISFIASATDIEDGNLSSAVVWESNVAGIFSSPAILSPGVHQISASVIDSNNSSATATINITVNPFPGTPVAHAGADQSVNENQQVTLDGSASSDSDGDIVSYEWTQTAGLPTNLNNPQSATPQFIAPAVSDQTTLTFLLKVTDNNGLTNTDSVSITVNNLNLAPIANAGLNQTVNANQNVSLIGNGTDSDGNVVSYTWTQTGGPSVSINAPNSSTATFIAPSLATVSILTFQLRVTDNHGATSTDTIDITVNKIDPNYCSSSGQNSTYEWINKISVGSFARTSGNNNGYNLLTSPGITLIKGTNPAIFLTPGFKSGSYSERWRIWVDLNINGTFETNELLFSGTSTSTSAISGNIAIPVSATSGATRMRISMSFSSFAAACGSFSYGEVEDYTVTLQ